MSWNKSTMFVQKDLFGIRCRIAPLRQNVRACRNLQIFAQAKSLSTNIGTISKNIHAAIGMPTNFEPKR